MNKKKGKLKRGMGILLALAMLFNTLPISGFDVSALEREETGLCQHHTEHTAECGYSRASEDGEENPCTYECRICLIEDMIAALPGEVTEDNAEKVRAQLNKILALYRELTAEEQEQIDLSHCLEQREQLDVNIPSLIAEAVSYRDCDANGQNWEEKTCETYTEVTSDATTWNSGWYVVSGSVTISSRVMCSGDVHLILMDGCILDAQQGITVEPGNSLTVYAQSGGTGSLTATASERAAGIEGSGNNKSGGTITINGGVVTVTGGSKDAYEGGAGIGGGYNASDVTVIIHGGTVNAAGGVTSAPGIGARNGGTVTITGGTVTATNFGKASVSTTGGTVNGTTYGILVTFVTNDSAVTIPEQSIGEGETATRPGDPNGYVLSFFSDASYTTPFDFGTAITQSVTIYVQCEENTNYLVNLTVNGVETKYTSPERFVEAVNGASGEVNAKLLQSVDLGSLTLTIPGGVTLTFSGGEYTLTGSDNKTVVVDGIFNLTGGTLLNTRGGTVLVRDSGSFIMSGGVVDYRGGGDNVAAVAAADDASSISISGGTVGNLGTTKGTVRLSGGTYSGICVSGKSAADILADGCALQVGDGLISKDTDLSTTQYNVSVVNPCPHGGLQDNGNGTHGGDCPYCGTKFEAASHTLGEGNKCEGCGAPLKVQVEIGNATTYYGDFDAAWAAAQGETATLSLLSNLTATTKLEMTGGNITFIGGDYTLTSTSIEYAVSVRSGILTVESGTIYTNTNGAAGVKTFGGTLEVTGGKIEAGYYGIMAQDGSVRISGGEVISGYYGLARSATNADVKISGGTISGVALNSGKVCELLLGYGTTTEPHYAFYQDGQPVNLPEGTTLSGTYTVRICNEPYTYTHTSGTTKHTQSCQYCGVGDSETDCSFTWDKSVGKCACGATLNVDVTGEGNQVYDGNAQTFNISVRLDNQELTVDTDYTVAYDNNTNAGTASVTVSGTGWNYEKNFTIKPATPTIAWSDTSQELIYTGNPAVITVPTVTLVNGETFSGTFNYSYAVGDSTSYTSGLPTNAGTYIIKASIAEQGNYTAADSTNTLALTIGKEQGTLTVPETSINKKFGDAEFSLNCSTNGDGKISYASSSEDVASVSADGNVRIKGVGETEITVSLAEGKNYTSGAGRKITVTVEKAAAPAIMDEIKQYTSTKGSGGGAAVMDVAGKLPDNRGKTTYNASVISDNAGVLSDVAVDENGNLTYKVKSGKAVSSEADIEVTIGMANYETAVFTLKIKIVEKIQVEITAKPENAVYDGSGHKGYADGITCDYPVEGYTFTYAGRESTEYNSSGPPKDAGSYTVTISVSDKSGDYYEKSVSLDFIIEKASVTIKADDKTVNKGAPLPELTYTVSGLAEKDSLAAAPEITCDADTKTEGSYPITVRGAKAPDTKNYNEEIIYEEGTLTVRGSSTGGASGSGGNSTGGTDTPQNPQEPETVPCAQVKSVKLSKTVYTYTGKAKKPAVIAVDTDGKRISGKYYTVSYKNNKKVGKATVTVKFKGGYSGSVTKTFTIRPAGTSIKKLTAVSSGFTVKWTKKTTQTSGYQIQYSTNAGFEGNSTCSVFVKKASVTKQTVKKLKAGKKYYVRIRTYKTVKTGEKSIKIYSAWSRAVRVKTLQAAPNPAQSTPHTLVSPQ